MGGVSHAHAGGRQPLSLSCTHPGGFFLTVHRYARI
jgi:hypothetical protein